MKKTLISALCILTVATLLSGCGDKGRQRAGRDNNQRGARTSASPRPAPSHGPAPAMSDNIFIAYDTGGAGYGTVIECLSTIITIYTNGRVEAHLDNDEQTPVGTYQLSTNDYQTIVDHIDREALYYMDIEEDLDVCDGNSTMLYLYDENDNLLISKGGYMVTTSEYNNMRQVIYEVLKGYGLYDAIYYTKQQLEAGATDRVITIPYVGDDYYVADSYVLPTKSSYNTPLIKRESEETNDIIDTYDWFEDNQLVNPDDYYIEEDDCYIFIGYNDSYTNSTIEIYDEYFNTVAVIDMSEYMIPADIKPGDEAFVQRAVTHARMIDDILYVSVAHSTYAESAPANGYVLAIDMTNYEVLWQSQALVSNSSNFDIREGSLITGYGFTDEDDYIYVLDRYTGEILQQEPVASGPDYLIIKDDKLYVRTYDKNYVYTFED